MVYYLEFIYFNAKIKHNLLSKSFDSKSYYFSRLAEFRENMGFNSFFQLNHILVFFGFSLLEFVPKPFYRLLYKESFVMCER